METVFISTSLPGRARPDYFFALAKSFILDGFRVVMIFDGKPKILPKDDGIIFLRWPNKRPTKLDDFIFLSKLIKEYKPSTLISSFGSVNIMNVCGYFFGVRNRLNYILSVSEPSNQKPSFNQIIIRNFLKTRKSKIYRLATLLVCNSTGTKRDAISFYNLEKKEFIVLHNLIRDSALRHKLREERKNQIIIVGNLILRKGHAVLLDQFKVSLDLYPQLKLLIIGSGIERKALILQAKELNIFEYIEFLNDVPNYQIDNYFSESLISISASRHEAFGFVNIEAMREGTPIISTPTAGALELLKEKVHVEFFSSDDLNSLTKAITVILNNWELFSLNVRESFTSYSLQLQINSHKDSLKKKLL